MKKNGLTIIFISIFINIFAIGSNDTIRVVIDLKQVDSLGLKIKIYPPSDISGRMQYNFPRSIPGIYEYLKNHDELINIKQNNVKINFVDNSYIINTDLENNLIVYSAKGSVKEMNSLYAEDSYFIKDSLYLLNWHYILGFFNNETNRPYKIEITKETKLQGTGGLVKKSINDTVDVFYASDYKKLIHSPILYSVPDTSIFRIGKTNFIISCAGKDTLLNSNKIKNLLYEPLVEIYDNSIFKHEEYTFLYFSDYSLFPPYLTGLEHPNSTLICYHSALLNNNILISSSIHEYIHAIYAPLHIRSEIINEFDFMNPKCDEFLWFYEGVTEYLAIKTLLNSRFFEPDDFLNELEESNNYHDNINFSAVSSNIYGKKEQKQYDNFYTKGSLFAMGLDIEILKKSQGKNDLFDVLQKLQNSYSPSKPFNSETFIADLSQIANVDIYGFLNLYTRKKEKIDYSSLIESVGYERQLKDSLIWTFQPSKIYIISNFRKDRLEIVFFGSEINEVCNSRKVSVYEINGTPVTRYNYDKLLVPKNGNEIQLKAIIKDREIEFRIRPKQILSKKKYVNWNKIENNDTEITKNFWQ